MNKASNTVYPLSALRAMVLHVQQLTTANTSSSPPTPDDIVDLVKKLGYVQIDTLYVVNRAHYVTLWARLGNYDLEVFNSLLYTPERRLYEGWGHAASIIPLEHYRYHRWRTDPETSYNPVFREWLEKKNNRELVNRTLERIRTEGGLRVGDFEYKGPKKGEWYDWKPPKMALEALFAWGDLMVAERVNFQRVYDVTKRVLPDWVDMTPVEPDNGHKLCLEQAAKALGVFDSHHLTQYAYMKSKPARPVIQELIDTGVLVKIKGESTQGVKTWLIHRENLPLLQQAADGEIQAERTTFIAPFDSLLWARGRDQKLFGFNQVLECYKPADQRVYGYFSFPILHKDQLVGRFDPKLDRKTDIMHLNTLFLEENIALTDELVIDVAEAMRDFLQWHEAKNLTIEKSSPAEFREKLLKAL